MSDLEPGRPEFEVSPDLEPVAQRDVIVIGASAGGVDALQRLAASFSPEFPASVLVVLHLMSSGTSVLDSILDRAGELPATVATDGGRLERGHIYVAPPDRHLLIRDGRSHLSSGPRENGHRPAIDPLFRSAARAFGPRAIGVILTGNRDDGTDGLRLIKERGGATVVQDPLDAAFPDMPANARDLVGPDRVVPLAEMGRALHELVDAPLESSPQPSGSRKQEIDLVEVELGREPPEGDPSLLTCPECGGVLLERDDGGHVRFACQVGHAYSPDSLVQEQALSLEAALWRAQRTLEERAELLNRLAERSGGERSARSFTRQAEGVERHAKQIRETIIRLHAVEEEDEQMEPVD